MSIRGLEENLYFFLFGLAKFVFIHNHSFAFSVPQSVDGSSILCFYIGRSPHVVGKSKMMERGTIMKKFLAIALAVCMVLSMACFASAEADLIKVGIINLDPSESGYREANVKDLHNVFTAENGYDATFVTAPTADKQLEAANTFKQMILDKFQNCDVRIEPCSALCSFYAEIGGMLVGDESL